MSEQEILEGNRLIAEFMEVDRFEAGSWQLYIQMTNGSYHSSWDWLMPVIIKIRELLCEAEFTNRLGYDLHYTQDIKKIWNSCVLFIKWYNQNKNKK
jgi:hypothetical protein